MNGILDYIASALGYLITVQIDVRLNGKKSGFDYKTQMWPSNNNFDSIEALILEVCTNSVDLNYANDLNPDSFFVYIERPLVKGDSVLKLDRLEDVEIVQNNARIRVQQWSDFVCDSGRDMGEESTLKRMELKMKIER
jgi:hypothetical protein